MTYVPHATVKKMKFKHENYTIDLTASNKAKLYFKNQLVFVGDGYKAITTMLNGSEDKEPVKQKFNAQLTMRQKPKFSSKMDELEKLRQAAEASIAQQELVKKSKKK